MVISERGVVKWAKHSDTMRASGMSWIDQQSRVPNGTATARLWQRLGSEATLDRVEDAVDSEVWFERSHSCHLWEEAMPLGYTGQVLTFLSILDEH